MYDIKDGLNSAALRNNSLMCVDANSSSCLNSFLQYNIIGLTPGMQLDDRVSILFKVCIMCLMCANFEANFAQELRKSQSTKNIKELKSLHSVLSTARTSMISSSTATAKCSTDAVLVNDSSNDCKPKPPTISLSEPIISERSTDHKAMDVVNEVYCLLLNTIPCL